MSRNNPAHFRRYLAREGKDIAAYVAPNPDISGVFRVAANDPAQHPTQPPPRPLSSDLDARADELEKLIADTQLTVCSLRKTAARLRGESS